MSKEIKAFSCFTSDFQKKKDGVWVEEGGHRFLIGSPNHLEVTKCSERHTAKALAKTKRKELKASEHVATSVQVIVDLKLLDWDVEVNGQKVEYSKEAAFNALINDSEFLRFVNDKSNDITLYEKEKRDKKVKKSSISSSGTKSTS